METDPKPTKILMPAILVSLMMFGAVYIAFRSALSRPGTVVLPGGITYLGSSPTPTPTVEVAAGTIPIATDAKWTAYTGKRYPYAFQYPSSLSIGWFPNDPYDAVTVFYANTDSNANVFFRVDDLTKLHKTDYIGKPMAYAQNWWKDYTWKGVSSVTEFTNANGLTGYRATYIDETDKTPYDHVFFTVPGRNDLIIWVSGKLFAPEVFDKIVDSVAWRQ
jgi:hypothetical protein